MKKLISVVLTIAVLLCICPRDDQIKAADVQTNTDLESVIREQIEAFAKSIDQKNADDAAAKALASHGISGRGKKLSVGKNHALTATLLNSNWLQEALTNSCVKMIESRELIGQSKVYGRGVWSWTEGRPLYHCCIYDYDFDINAYREMATKKYSNLFNTDYIAFIKDTRFTEPKNTYDSSLVMMAGQTIVAIELNLNQTTKDTEIYDVVLKIIDRFDFSVSGNGGFKDFISGIGALLFKEFDWESKVTFQLTVPNECEHTFNDETDSDCNGCGYVREMRGDMNGDSTKNSADAIYLLRHSIMPEMYPLSQAADVNGDGIVNSADAVYLLRHTIMPQAYPLK